MKQITVVSLSSGDPELLNGLTLNALKAARTLVLRTDHHPIAAWLRQQGIAFRSFDSLYDQTEDFDTLHRTMAETLWQEAGASGLVYGVPDPLSDGSVLCLLSCRPSPEDRVEILPGIGITEGYLNRCRGALQEPDRRVAAAFSLFTADYDPNRPLLITELDSEILAGEVKAFLESRMADEDTLLFFSDPDHPPREIPLYELDRQRTYDHRSALLIPARSPEDRSRFTLSDLERKADQQLALFLRRSDADPADEAGPEDPDEAADALAETLLKVVHRACLAKAMGEFDLRDVLTRAYRLAGRLPEP
ncbi:MAG: hypothetical protein J6U01_04405 [Clostridia bacterium]|nr:hypothetical protein [Clostridia bacterium]